MKNFFSKNKKIITSFAVVFILVFVFFLYPQISYAAGEGVAKVLGWIIYPFIWIFGKLAILFLDILISIAQYDNFIHSSAVSYGWIVVRDLCNMFFVLILLIIAFASILRIESYNLKTWLPKLVIMAVLINFSKLICGLFIDFSQVIMLTFINAIKDIAGPNLTEMLGISKILSASSSQEAQVDFSSVIGSIILGLVIVIIATVVILTMTVMLAMRVVMIWIYVVLSPLAYLLASFPQGQQYSQKWWSDFSKNLIIGPVLAFFLWLSFASLGGLNGQDDIKKMSAVENNVSGGFPLTDGTPTSTLAVASTQAGTKDNMILFIVSIGMLLGGMMIAQEMGGAAGKVVGKGMAKMQAMGAGAIKMGKRATGIERAENAYKSYKSQKESKRQDLAQKDAGSMLKAEAKAKQAIASVPQKVGGAIIQPFKKKAGVSDAQIKQKENDVQQAEREKELLKGGGEQLRTDLDKLKEDKESLVKVEGEIQIISDLENEKNTKHNDLENEKNTKVADYNQRIAAAAAGGNTALVGTLATERDNTVADYNQRINDSDNNHDERILAKEEDVVIKFNSATGQTLTSVVDVATELPQAKINKDVDIANQNQTISDNSAAIDAKSADIETRHQDIQASKKKAEKFEKWGSVIGGATAMLGALALSGVAAPVGAGLAVAGGAAFGRKRIKHAGDDALDLASNYNSSQIGKHKEKMKDEKEEDLRKTMNDYSRSGHERTAAAMTLMEQGKLSKEEAKVKSTEISKSYEKDNKVLTQLDGAMNHNYQELTRVFSDINSTDPSKKDKAETKIVNGIITGDIKMHNIDDQNVLDKLMPKLAEKMTPANFKNMYNNQTTEKRDKIKKALGTANTAGSDKAGEQLVNIQNKLDPLRTDDKKMDYVKNAGKDQIKSLAENIDGLKSLADVLKKNKQLQLYASTGNNTEFRKTLNDMTKKAQFNTSALDSSILKEIMNAMK